MDEMRVVRSDSNRRRRQTRRKRKKNNRNAILLLIMAAVLIVLVVLLLTQPSSDSDSSSGSDSGAESPSGTETADDPPFRHNMDLVKQDLISGGTIRLSLTVGDTYRLALPDDADIRDVFFESDNSAVVRVDAAGRIDALRTGTAKILAYADDFHAACECTVEAADHDPDGGTDEYLSTAITANEDVAERNLMQYLQEPYSITVNRRTDTVTVYTYDSRGNYTVPVRAMVCSCGRDGYDTPTGEYEIYYREEDWLELNGDVYGLYISGFFDDYLFHSVPYYYPGHDALKVDEFNKLGTNASDGCVRMMIGDVMWVYENCGVGTPVQVIDADASADPLGRPVTVKLDGSASWDPTDPDPDNPYCGRIPAITGADDTTLSRGDSFDPMDGISATDAFGNDLTGRVQVTGSVVNVKYGDYYLTYRVEDDFGQTCTVTRTVTVD